MNWGLEGCGANKHDEGGTFVVDIAEGIIESPPSKLKCHLRWRRVGGREKVMSLEEEKSMTWANEDPDRLHAPTLYLYGL